LESAIQGAGSAARMCGSQSR